MTGISFSVDLKDEEARLGLSDLLARIDNRRPFYEQVGQILVDGAGRRFETETDPDGAAWKPLRRATIRARERRGKSQIRILREYGHLAGSISFDATDEETRVGSAVDYAAIHQLGGVIEKAEGTRWMAGRRFAKRDKAPEGKDKTIAAHSITIPARPFLGLSADDEADIVSAVDGWLNG